jgi:hypothetical protein
MPLVHAASLHSGQQQQCAAAPGRCHTQLMYCTAQERCVQRNKHVTSCRLSGRDYGPDGFGCAGQLRPHAGPPLRPAAGRVWQSAQVPTPRGDQCAAARSPALRVHSPRCSIANVMLRTTYAIPMLLQLSNMSVAVETAGVTVCCLAMCRSHPADGAVHPAQDGSRRHV